MQPTKTILLTLNNYKAMKLNTEIFFSINDALVNAAKNEIAENARELNIAEDIISAELEKVTLEYNRDAYTDQDSSNLYHASYYAECEVNYSGNNPEFEQAIKNLEPEE